MSVPVLSLKGKRALITGGRRGIGKAIALAFAEAGADVAVCDLVMDDGRLKAVAEDIKRIGRRSLAVQVDTSRSSNVMRCVQKVLDEFKKLEQQISDPAVVSNPSKLKAVSIEYNELKPTIEKITEFRETERQLAENEKIIEEDNETELKELAENEIGTLKSKILNLKSEL